MAELRQYPPAPRSTEEGTRWPATACSSRRRHAAPAGEDERRAKNGRSSTSSSSWPAAAVRCFFRPAPRRAATKGEEEQVSGSRPPGTPELGIYVNYLFILIIFECLNQQEHSRKIEKGKTYLRRACSSFSGQPKQPHWTEPAPPSRTSRAWPEGRRRPRSRARLPRQPNQAFGLGPKHRVPAAPRPPPLAFLRPRAISPSAPEQAAGGSSLPGASRATCLAEPVSRLGWFLRLGCPQLHSAPGRLRLRAEAPHRRPGQAASFGSRPMPGPGRSWLAGLLRRLLAPSTEASSAWPQEDRSCTLLRRSDQPRLLRHNPAPSAEAFSFVR